MASGTVIALAAVVAALGLAAPASAAPTTITGSLVPGDTDQTNRIFLNGRTSGCGTAKPAPGTAAVGTFNVDVHTLTNATIAPACVTVEMLFSGCGGTANTVVAYGGYNPASPGANYLGDSGQSPTDDTGLFSFRVAPGATYQLVVAESSPGAGCPSYRLDVHQAPVAAVYEGAGNTPASIQTAIDGLRAELGGGSVPAAGGSFGGLRREINWDGVPDNLAAPNNLPGDFFNVNSPRGVVLSTPGTGLQVSADSSNPTSTPVEFGNINPGYAAVFQPFSPQRLFSMLGGQRVTADFRLVGTSTQGFTRGFGTVFTNTATFPRNFIRLLDGAGNDLGIYVSPPGAGAENLTFIGAAVPERTVASVEVHSSFEDTLNAVPVPVMDDFIYGEPGTGPPAEPGPGAAADVLAPETQLDKTPKKKVKTRKRKVKASFAFSSSEAGSTFECRLDKGDFAPCGSPFTKKVKKGKHTFAVRATDAAKNVDATPADFKWKVMRKKKR